MGVRKLACCYRGYYSLFIHPAGKGLAKVSTCCYNTFIPRNKLIVKRGIQDAWNSRQFQSQRRFISNNDWRFCEGSNCSYNYILASEEKFVNEDDIKRAIAEKKTKLDYLPKKIVINLSNICNNNCDLCFRDKKKKNNVAHDIGDTLIEEIKRDIIPYCECVVISGGEPFFNKTSRDFIDWLISEYPDKKKYVLTNGILLDQFGLQKIIESNIFLLITIYGMCRDTYKKVTGRDNFRALYNSLGCLIKSGYRQIRLRYIVSDDNVTDLESFCEFIDSNQEVRALIRNNFYEGSKHFKTIQFFQEKYSHISSRLRFQYQYLTFWQRIVHKLYKCCVF
ncbi:MAG: radical SAM protein [Candidatus Omnitrophota bacterium]